jgi:hypothetical protein
MLLFEGFELYVKLPGRAHKDGIPPLLLPSSQESKGVFLEAL